MTREGGVEHLDGLLQVDDMNAVTLGEDVRLHTGIPLVGAVPKVHAALKQGLHGYCGHDFSLMFLVYLARHKAVRHKNGFSGVRVP